MTLVFEEPPAAPASAGRPVSEKWAAIVADLQAAQGKWARVAPLDGEEPFDTSSKANSLANRIRKGQSAAFRPEGHFQAVGRPWGDGFGVWASYVGEERDPVEEYANAHKLAELKEEARNRDLKVSGTRLELAARILEHDAAQEDDSETDVE